VPRVRVCVGHSTEDRPTRLSRPSYEVPPGRGAPTHVELVSVRSNNSEIFHITARRQTRARTGEKYPVAYREDVSNDGMDFPLRSKPSYAGVTPAVDLEIHPGVSRWGCHSTFVHSGHTLGQRDSRSPRSRGPDVA
jgi:hypothetical protein